MSEKRMVIGNLLLRSRTYIVKGKA